MLYDVLYDVFEKLEKVGMKDVDGEFEEAVEVLSRINEKLEKVCKELIKEESADLVLLSLASNITGILNAIEKMDPEVAAEIREVVFEIISEGDFDGKCI